MSNAVIAIYRFFQRNRYALYFLLGLLIVFIIFFGSKIRMEEDISGYTGSGKTHKILSQFRFPEKLIVLLSQTKTTDPPDPERLSDVAGIFTGQLQHDFDSGYIRSVSGRIPDTLMTWYRDFFYSRLPLYLEEEDYLRIGEMIRPENAKKSILSDFKLLSSPAGYFAKQTIPEDPLGFTYLVMDKLRKMETSDRFELFDGYVVSKDRRNLLLFITPANPPNETSKNAGLLKGIDKLLGEISQKSGGRIKSEYFGAIAMSCGNAERIKKDILLSACIAVFLILLLTGYFFRSVKIPLLSFLPALFGGGLSLAVIFLIKSHISAIALGVGSVILGLIVDYALYLINHFRKKRDIVTSLRELSQTIILCALTTIGAFLCMIFLESSVLHDLGLFSALSVAGAALFALLFLPHLVSGKDFQSSDRPTITAVEKTAGYRFEKNLWIIGFFIVAGIVSFFMISRVGFEKDMMALNYYPGNLRQSEDHITAVTGGSTKSIYLASTGNNLDQALENNEELAGRIDSLRKEKIVSQYSGIGFLLPSSRLQKKRLQRWHEFWTEEKIQRLESTLRDEGKRLRFRADAFEPFYAWLRNPFHTLSAGDASVIRKEFLSDWIHEGNEGVVISSVLQVPPGKAPSVYTAFPVGEHLQVFDRQLLTNRFVESVKRDFDLLVKLSMIFVTLLLLFALGRIELAFIAALPMYFSWLLTLGFMGITGIRFNIFNIIVSSFIFGLGVDYSILMLRGLLHDTKYGTREISSYKTSIILSSATTLFGVGALFSAKHPAIHSIALISVIGIVLVVLVSFTFQPLIANEFFVRRARQKKYPVTARIFVKTIITWGDIVIVAILLTISGLILRFLVPVSKKKKERIFHKLFQVLSRLYIQVTFPPRSRKIINENGETFGKPAVIISNHQSLIETPAFLRLHSKIIILTSDWVYKSVVFGPVARLASFFNADKGIDNILGELKEKVAEGYSILVFPEAHRSEDHSIQRFHKGAFYLAEKLQIDILPIVVFGTGDFLGKGQFWGRPNPITMKILERVSIDDHRFGTTYKERAKGFRKFYTGEYRKLRSEEGTTRYYRKLLTLNYIYKGPILEWYFRVKLKLAGNYRQFNEIIPAEGSILDIGCGYGFISTMLSVAENNRVITGIDYDPEKIAVARNCFLNRSGLTFECSDIISYDFGRQHAFLLSDVLHYLDEKSQEDLLSRCIDNLNPGGVIVIREADRGAKRNHVFTRITEYFSTRILGFNRTSEDSGALHFLAKEKLSAIAVSHGLVLEVLEKARNTSNILFLIRKP